MERLERLERTGPHGERSETVEHLERLERGFLFALERRFQLEKAASKLCCASLANASM